PHDTGRSSSLSSRDAGMRETTAGSRDSTPGGEQVHVSPRLGAAIATISWGLSFVATKAAVQEISPVTLIFTRFALGLALLFIVLRARRKRLIPPRALWGNLVLMGFISIFVHQMLQAHALTLTSAVNTGWLIGLTPIWSAVLAAFILKERFGPAKTIGLAVGFLGAALVVTQGRLGSVQLVPSTRGDLLILASTLNWAIFTVLSRPILDKLDPLEFTVSSMFLGWIMLAPFFVVEGSWRQYASLTTPGWIAVLFLAIVCSGIAYLLWYEAVARLETSRVASFLYLEPLVTAVGAAVLLAEPVRLITVIGGLLLLGGVMLVQRAQDR
ncbi:MAG: DMT family transporter, partial [bacterium]